MTGLNQLKWPVKVSQKWTIQLRWVMDLGNWTHHQETRAHASWYNSSRNCCSQQFTAILRQGAVRRSIVNSWIATSYVRLLVTVGDTLLHHDKQDLLSDTFVALLDSMGKVAMLSDEQEETFCKGLGSNFGIASSKSRAAWWNDVDNQSERISQLL